MKHRYPKVGVREESREVIWCENCQCMATWSHFELERWWPARCLAAIGRACEFLSFRLLHWANLAQRWINRRRGYDVDERSVDGEEMC